MNKISQISYTEQLESWIRDNYSRFTVTVTSITIIFLVAYFLPSLLRMDLYSNDMQQFVSWSYSYQDPELFNNHDLIKDYFTTNSPIGYKFFFRVFTTLIDPQILAELLAFGVGVCGALLSYLIGRKITDEQHWGGLASLTLFLFSIYCNNVSAIAFLRSIAGGLPRNFALPIILLGVLSLLRRDFGLLGIAIVLGALFYPPTCITLIMYGAVTFTVQLLRERVIHRYWLKTICGSAIAVTILLWIKKTTAKDEFGDVYSLQQALQMPEFHSGGLLPLLGGDWKMYVLDIFQLNNVPSFIWLAIVGITVFAITTNKSSNRQLFRSEIGILCLSALINYALAYAVFIKLYEPSRYVSYVWQCLSLCIFPFTCELVLKFIQARLTKINNPNLFGKVELRWIAIGLTIFALTTFSLRFTLNRGGIVGTLPAQTYQFLKTLPKDTIIAAHPRDASDIPMRSQRSVLLMFPALYPYNVKFYEEMKARLLAIWAAMYAMDIQPIVELHQKYKVNYFILNKNLYQNDDFPYQPFPKQQAQFKSNLGAKEPLISLLAKKEAVVFQSDKIYVLDLEKLISTHSKLTHS